MEITELMKSRRTVHQYKSEKVPEKIILGALEVALWAPNHRLTFPWRFVLVGDQARAKIADLASELKAQKKGLSQVEAAALRATYMNPSHLIVLAQKSDSDPEITKEDYASVAMGVQNASLFLWAHGVGSKWTTGAVTSHEKTREYVGSHLHGEEILGFFWVGIPAQPPRVPGRPPLSDFLRRCP